MTKEAVNKAAEAVGKVEIIYLTANTNLLFHASHVKRYVLEIEQAGAHVHPDLKGRLRYHAAELHTRAAAHGSDEDRRTEADLRTKVETFMLARFGEALDMNVRAA